MDVMKHMGKYKSLISKYRIPALVLLIGIVLMSFPNWKKDQQISTDNPQPEDSITIEDGLSEILSTVDGAGKVRVYVSFSSGEETIYQTDIDASTSDASSTQRVTTVTVTGDDRSEAGLVKQVNPPTILGVIVTCQGADRASVRLAVVDAVSKATGLGADCIAVLKMK